MSAVSSRRVRDPNTGFGLKSSKAVTPLSMSGKNPNGHLQKSSSGKENIKHVYRALGSGQKVVIRPVPRVEKAALGGENGARLRLSASSALRGRSPSPSEFVRVFSDLKREKESKALVDSSDRSSSKGINGCRNAGLKRFQSDSKNYTDSRISNGLVCEEFVRDSSYKADLITDSAKSNSLKGSSVKGATDVNSKSDSDIKPDPVFKEKSGFVSKSDCKVEKIGQGVPSVSKKTSSDCHAKVSESSKEKIASEGMSRPSNKYPSKLHEKLAFLEGKVKRIASDIKRTKDMLDINNPDSSKLILSDIQEKISGIEKAMSNVVVDSDSKVSVSRGNEDLEMKELERMENHRLPNMRCSVKGLNNEELEDRLFPHHKLLRNRKTSKASSGGSQKHEQEGELNGENPQSPVEEDLIALEFLAALGKDQSKAMMIGEKNSESKQIDGEATSQNQDSTKMADAKPDFDLVLTSDERLDDFDDQENRQEVVISEEDEDTSLYQLNAVGRKTSTGGWFVSEGEAVLLVHDDGSCSYYDVANCEEKSVYRPSGVISSNIWTDCWIIRAAGADGCSGKYVVAASAGNTLDSGFCSWDFYTKDVHALHTEDRANPTPRTPLGPLSNNADYWRNTLSGVLIPENSQWWYRPCGPLIASTAASQKTAKVFDIRDGEQLLKWEVQKPVTAMDYSSPLQWRSRGKLVIAESETISLWDVNSLNPEALLSASSSGRKISALHINNTDAELGGGVRQRVSSSEAEGHDGVFCTVDAINILDFRNPSGIGMKIPKLGVSAQSVFSRGDAVILGCASMRSTLKKQITPQIHQFSLRKQRLVSTFSLPESNRHPHHSAITQVWGNSNFVMGVSGMGLHVFDAAKNDGLDALTPDYSGSDKTRETIGPDDMYHPSFDYLGSRVLLISRDRPAVWRHLL